MVISALQYLGGPHVADRHEITVVLINNEGRRIGESAFFLDFVVKRRHNF
jgi:hypothetical protein